MKVLKVIINAFYLLLLITSCNNHINNKEIKYGKDLTFKSDQEIHRQLQAFMNAWRSSPCIPWDYLEDGCWSRTHFGWNLSKSMDFELDKIWIEKTAEGNRKNIMLRYPEKDSNRWGNHVALYKMVNDTIYVIDGSLFKTPVKLEVWKEDVQFQDPFHKITLLSGRRYGPIINEPFVPEFDDNLIKTKSDLAKYWRNFKMEPGGYLPDEETWLNCNLPKN